MLRYRFLLALLSPVIWTYLWLRGRKEPAYRQRWAERLGWVNVAPHADIWIHGASLGELMAAKPLIDACLQQHRVLVTAFTPAGTDYIQRQYGERVQHCYLPLDWSGAVRRFLRRAQPKRLIVLETEFWPNLLLRCQQQGIDVCFASARITGPSVKQYQRLLGRQTLAKLFKNIRLIAAQTEADKQRFLALGAVPEQVRVAGNIKFDLSLPADFAERLAPLKAQMAGRQILLAASTHAGEELASVRIYQALKSAHPNLLLVIAPRHQNRFDDVAKELAALATLARRSQKQPLSAATDIYLADSLGELMLFYALADVAFVAGSLAPIGGHNVLEAALVDTPVVVGPHLHEQPVAQELVAQGAILQGQDEAELLAQCRLLLGDADQATALSQKASAFLQQNRGALARSLALLAIDTQ